MRFVAVGDAFVDVLCDTVPQPRERRHGKVVLRAGGSSVNAVLVARELGAEAQVVGRVGNDPAGDLVVSTLERRGVETHLFRDDELPTGTAVALGDAVVADRGANARLSRDDLPWPLEGDALLVSGFALFQEGSRAAALAALEQFDGTWAGVDLGSPKLARGADLDIRANVVFATAAEAEAITGLEPEAAARELATHFEIACVKLGAEGAIGACGNQTEHAHAPRVVRTAPFGAGDAFAAAFLVALVAGAGLDVALERACAAGAAAAAALPGG